jgi:hypothetical protein
MVAQTKVDIRSAAAKTAAADKQGPQDEVVVDNKDLLQDQAAAAAVVDAGQSDAVAVQVTAEAGILPTDAPLQSIGEIAQAPAPTTTDTTTPATTPAPAAEAEAATALSPWAIGGIALVGIGAVAAAANSGDDDNPVAAPPPPPGGNEPPANVAPTSTDQAIVADADGQTALSSASFLFNGPEADQTLASVTIASVAPNVTESATLQFDEATGHAYQFVAGPGISWADANAAAIAAGGHLLVIDSTAELELVRDSFATATAAGLGGSTGADGTWIGLTQAAGSATLTDGWAWTSVTGVEAGGAAFPGAGSTWNAGEPNDSDDNEDGQDQWGAIYQGGSPTDTALIYDWDNSNLPNYIIEFESALTLNGNAVAPGQVVAAADLGGLTWNSVFNDGGTVTYNVTDSGTPNLTSAAPNTLTFTNPVTFDGGASQSISAMIEDQHLTGLA